MDTPTSVASSWDIWEPAQRPRCQREHGRSEHGVVDEKRETRQVSLMRVRGGEQPEGVVGDRPFGHVELR